MKDFSFRRNSFIWTQLFVGQDISPPSVLQIQMKSRPMQMKDLVLQLLYGRI